MENEKQPYKEIPTGTGRESEPKETLPAIEVDNEVEWVNPEFEKMPFNLKEGESTKLGIFLTPEPKEKEKSFDLKVMLKHGRSGLVGRAIFKDNQGRLYRDIDLKGAGKVEFKKSKPQVGRVERKGLDRVEGMLSAYKGKKSVNMAEKFLELGIRTERYLALIKLKEIIDENGEKVPIEEARKRRIIHPNQELVIGVRAFGTKHRILGMNDTTLADAKMLVAQEIGKKEKEFSWHDYLKWFSQTLGKNVGLMHKNDYVHGYLRNHNITLDCRIIDLDSVTVPYGEGPDKVTKKRKNDWINSGYGALQKLFKKVSPKDKECKDFEEYLNYFDEAYRSPWLYAGIFKGN